MKVFALILSIFALACSALALKDPICALPSSEIGICRAMLPRYTYVASSNECVKFFYGGCDGNENNFHTMEECVEKCKE
ncbi:kappaPI-actitoxin-Avd3b-like [Stomoxys calcitrans]|uniref:kappaPI-actitoxin-Avd3b-like n=1 Tax=Stomoxys calcitrans TaxID=35570 RepID=UPI0027E2969C|nr:kappaPI-actitoxin-Avd3b-like [Stomoxys calcitrans]